jgi:hypothetical protein
VELIKMHLKRGVFVAVAASASRATAWDWPWQSQTTEVAPRATDAEVDFDPLTEIWDATEHIQDNIISLGTQLASTTTSANLDATAYQSHTDNYASQISSGPIFSSVYKSIPNLPTPQSTQLASLAGSQHSTILNVINSFESHIVSDIESAAYYLQSVVSGVSLPQQTATPQSTTATEGSSSKPQAPPYVQSWIQTLPQEATSTSCESIVGGTFEFPVSGEVSSWFSDLSPEWLPLPIGAFGNPSHQPVNRPPVDSTNISVKSALQSRSVEIVISSFTQSPNGHVSRSMILSNPITVPSHSSILLNNAPITLAGTPLFGSVAPSSGHGSFASVSEALSNLAPSPSHSVSIHSNIPGKPFAEPQSVDTVLPSRGQASNKPIPTSSNAYASSIPVLSNANLPLQSNIPIKPSFDIPSLGAGVPSLRHVSNGYMLATKTLTPPVTLTSQGGVANTAIHTAADVAAIIAALHASNVPVNTADVKFGVERYLNMVNGEKGPWPTSPGESLLASIIGNMAEVTTTTPCPSAQETKLISIFVSQSEYHSFHKLLQ